MGTSYQTLLLIGEQADLRAPLVDLDADGWLVPVGPQRVALLPREGDRGYADVHSMAHLLGARLEGPVLTNEVSTSDRIVMGVFEQGRLIHEYVADRSDPASAVGADPAAFVPFGVGQVDPHRLGAALRGEFEGGNQPPAEFQHWLRRWPCRAATACRRTGNRKSCG